MAVINSGMKVSVAGCLPPIFGSYEPQRFEPERVQDYLGVFIVGLEPYVDLWLGETLTLIAEGEAVRPAVQPTNKPLGISFSSIDALLLGSGAAAAARHAHWPGVDPGGDRQRQTFT
ncbi:MAG: hypothetical protein E5X49_09470 [Mesorhizobium sp.]|nr:MAG: hypothetical protein EOQ28_23605 [Mesorhizobium sp.]RWB98142.1 MAG: hypothetical protein EOQ57_22555 [Mesorhizobium sp.]RWG85144.1 MAG: hypothetical protein EOQ69_08790 [Mesorhizobium sp.]RWG88927.1 MAG: hypothetical protein EOQ70_09660 [Mesorhizobium sp.]RWK02226.1 MAG: hypothetical protein EOR42_20140 [Mesorhizobium sp.]